MHFKAGAAMRGSDRIRDLTVLSGGRELRLSTRVSETECRWLGRRGCHTALRARAFIDAPIESVKLKLRSVERWQRAIGESEHVDRLGNAGPEPTCWVSFGCEDHSQPRSPSLPDHAQSEPTRQSVGDSERASAAPGTTTVRPTAGSLPSSVPPRTAERAPGTVFRAGTDIVNPRLIREVRPQYTAEALRAKITGTVYLEMVILADGTVGNVRITRSLDPVFGLDEEAVKAARQWLFEPGTRFGEPVAVQVNLALDFNLRYPSDR